ncbi:MAG: CHAT domain-containing protein, partial [Burkholderiaceae bacterium]|nr:CHAT domain-containing protein [Burkholderiaceae bacterium]
IPFVAAEAALLQAIWGIERLPVTRGAATLRRLREQASPLDALVLSAHGDELPGPPTQTVVRLAAASDPELMLDTTEVLSAVQQPRDVVISACVAGRVREDAMGEPLGLVSAFFLKGARFALAPLQPVPDFPMPLLMGLFHLAWRDGASPHEAFGIARRQALEGDWPAGFVGMVRAAYTPVMLDLLERAVSGEAHWYSHIGEWTLPQDVREAHFPQADHDLWPVQRWAFERDHCATPAARAGLVASTLDRLIAPGQPPSDLRFVVEWTTAFGR